MKKLILVMLVCLPFIGFGQGMPPTLDNLIAGYVSDNIDCLGEQFGYVAKEEDRDKILYRDKYNRLQIVKYDKGFMTEQKSFAIVFPEGYYPSLMETYYSDFSVTKIDESADEFEFFNYRILIVKIDAKGDLNTTVVLITIE